MGGVAKGAEFVGGLFGGIGARDAERREKEETAKLELQEAKDAAIIHSTQLNNRVSEINASQMVRQASSGFTLSSPSFTSFQAKTFNELQKDEDINNINLDYAKIAAANKINNAESDEIWGDVGSLFNAGYSLSEGGFATSVKSPESFL